MVLAGIMLGDRADLHIFDRGSVTARKYRDNILEFYIRLIRVIEGS